MLANSQVESNMDKEKRHFKMDPFMKEVMKMVYLMVMES